jgi:hypothetical protein
MKDSEGDFPITSASPRIGPALTPRKKNPEKPARTSRKFPHLGRGDPIFATPSRQVLNRNIRYSTRFGVVKNYLKRLKSL